MDSSFRDKRSPSGQPANNSNTFEELENLNTIKDLVKEETE